MRDQLIHRWRLLRWALIEIPLAALSLAAFVFTITDVALIAVWVGIPMLAKDIAVTRWLADLHRRYAGGFRGVAVDGPTCTRQRGIRSRARAPSSRIRPPAVTFGGCSSTARSGWRSRSWASWKEFSACCSGGSRQVSR
jgi:hypothetical protein